MTVMKNFLKEKSFLIGFLFGLSLTVLTNYYDYQSENMFSCDDCILSLGYPFTFYREGGFVTIKEIVWVGLISDVFIAIIFSFIVGLLFKLIWSKFQTNKLR